MEKLNDFTSKSGEETLRRLTGLKKTLRTYRIKNGECNLFEKVFAGRSPELKDTRMQAEREGLERFLARAKNNATIGGNSEAARGKSYLQKERC